MASMVTWLIITILLSSSSSQTLHKYTKEVLPNQGICKGVESYSSLQLFYEAYKKCTVVVGNLLFTLLERTNETHFKNISFPNLREVTGFFVVYRVNGLDSLGRLFPNLARVRGEQVINNFGLVIHDMSNLVEIGLYGLLKVDRGGIIVWGLPHACFVDTIDWSKIAPRSRHVINVNFQEKHTAHCDFKCTCSLNDSLNRCWNNKHCQIYLSGPDADKCHDQCIGCRKTRSDHCSLCRYYTYNGQCLSKCPENTIILPDCQYCVTIEECKNLFGWVFNNTCVFHCPIDFVEQHTAENETVCEPCPNCNKICPTQVLETMRSIQAAEKCVIINGSLEIHIRFLSEAMDELRTYLGRIEEVTDYILIYSSNTITSLDFLPSLKIIHGKNLMDGKYSLAISDMTSLKSLFDSNVTKHLKIENGTLNIYHNPVLCASEIDKIKSLFPVAPNDIDVPLGENGYSGSCKDTAVGFQISVVNETSIYVTISTLADPDAHYSILYVRLPYDSHETLVLETCSEYEWYAVSANTKSGIVKLTSLRPASTYAICIETYNPVDKKLGRSKTSKFSTPVGTPEPPFITELTAKRSDLVLIRWINHKDYRPHIKYYELDITLIEISEKDVRVKDQCHHQEVEDFGDITRHGFVMKPPPEYLSGCESVCDALHSATAGALDEEYFDVCSSIQCDVEEESIKVNTSKAGKIKTLVFNITTQDNVFQIEGLTPYQDYRLRLRACTNRKCSRSARSVIRTLASKTADKSSIIHVNATEYGNISITWKPPNVTNGPIMSYLVEILPMFRDGPFVHLLSQKWCLLADQTSHKADVLPADRYLINVCTRSMAPIVTCDEKLISVKTTIPVTDTSVIVSNRWWLGLLFGIVLYMSSIVIGYRIKRKASLDLQPIIDSESSLRNESDPPIKLLSNFAVMYSIPLRDTQLD